MFKFNFNSKNESNKSDETNTVEQIEWKPSAVCTVNKYNPKLKEFAGQIELGCFSCVEGTQLFYVPPSCVLDYLKESDISCDILSANENNTDLIAGKYEGGLKIWECTKDLANYICVCKVNVSNKAVLDLGCGMGVIGILCLMKNAQKVDFQDYNDDVLYYLTMTNLQVNNFTFDKSNFYSGDWSTLANVLEETKKESTEETKNDHKYDFIFTSETIYNPINYTKLINLFREVLRPGGTIILAAKVHYFGVGGGLRSFEDALEEDGTFKYKPLWKSSEGLIREIVEIRFK